MEPGVVFIIIIVIALIIALGVYGAKKEKERRESIAALGQRLGLDYSRPRDRHLARELDFLNKLRQGSNRYAENVLKGTYEDHPVLAFDYHYETQSTDSKGNRQTHHHRFSVVTLTLPKSFPELRIAKETFFSKIAQAVGFDDIDFESHEFSKEFVVRSKDKKFAYDFCNALMIEYLLENKDLTIEVDENHLALLFSNRLSAEEYEANLARIVKLRRLMPDYLF